MEFLTMIYAIVRAFLYGADPNSHDELAVLDDFFDYKAPYIEA